MNIGRVILSIAIFELAIVATAQTIPPPAPDACTGPAYHSFDFWLGEWDVYNVAGGARSAHVTVSSILKGCALREEYQGVDGSAGESLSSFDVAHQLWRQFWVSGTGQIISIYGALEGGAIILTGPEEGVRTSLVRGTWKPEHGGVREIAERSHDNGRTWQPWFDLHFRRSPAAAPVPAGNAD